MTEPTPKGAGRLEGTVLRRSSQVAWVDTSEGVLTCSLRGKLRGLEPCVAGDQVMVSLTGPGAGAVEDVLPRRSVLMRGGLTGEPSGRIAASNIDQVAVVITASSPAPRWSLVDRLLVEAECRGLGALVAVNKMDLAAEGSPERTTLEPAIEDYRRLGVPVFPVSALGRVGLDELGACLSGRTTVFSGHSGVGKTALVNALVLGTDLATGDVNPVTGKGRHTTSATVLVKLAQGGYIMDTPGFREFALLEISPPDLGRYYPDFREVIGGCRYKDCLHQSDPGCALRLAVEAGKVSKLRYQNYLQILATLIEKGVEKRPRRSARRGSPEPS